MGRFNEKTVVKNKTINLAGAEAYSQSSELEVISMLLTSFATDQFYQSAQQTFDRLKNLISNSDKRFVANAIVYARTQFGMRSISHVAASELAKYISGEPWAKSFYAAVVYRPDDMCEILAYHYANNGKTTNAMKKGFAAAFDKFDGYQLAKYRMEGKSVSLVDAVNIVHPIPTEKNQLALSQLVKGELVSTDTWESKLSAVGSDGNLKKEVWESLINERKIGYFALLRNMRNIIQQAPGIVTKACELLVDENLIRKSLVLPFRFTTAYEEIEKMASAPKVREVIVALNKAVDISMGNVPKLPGNTLVALDVSGSMRGKPADIGSLFAATLVKSNNCDLITFDTHGRYINYNPLDSTITIRKSIPFSGGGTNFDAIFLTAREKYDRIIILSDMQSWVTGKVPRVTYNAYKAKYDTNPLIYSFDLQGYGSLQFPENRVYTLAGFSEKIFDIMALLEQDVNALINKIKNFDF
jgi:60 kDa SS-A/Ro ribonucleoprotein